MAQADNTKANKLAHLHMRIVRRVLRCMLNFLVTRGNPLWNLDRFIEENGDRILQTDTGRRNRRILFPRHSEVTIDTLPLYLVEFLIADIPQCYLVPRHRNDSLHEINRIRKEAHFAIVKGIGDTSLSQHFKSVEKLLTSLCLFMANSQLQSEVREEIENILQCNVNTSDDVLEEFKQLHEIEKANRKSIPSFTQEYLTLHRMIEHDVSILEADEPGHVSDERALPPRPADKYKMQVPEAVIEIAVQSTNDTVTRDLVNTISRADEDGVSETLTGHEREIRNAFTQAFSYYGDFYAKQGCVQIWVRPKSIKHLFELFEDCVSGKITKNLKPVEKLIQCITDVENYEQEAVLYQDHYDSVINDIASQMLHIFGARGISLPDESTTPRVELSEKGTIIVRVACPSNHERNGYERAIKDGRFDDSFRQLEVNLRDAFELPDLTLDATVSERRSENFKNTATIKHKEHVFTSSDTDYNQGIIIHRDHTDSRDMLETKRSFQLVNNPLVETTKRILPMVSYQALLNKI